jgi:DNA-directed RNA polymerase subunit RPC12/RpoP
MPTVCEWTEDDDGNWLTDCENMHEFSTGGPDENGYVYCPYCGKRVGEKERKEETEKEVSE